jgi:hypothetical protein
MAKVDCERHLLCRSATGANCSSRQVGNLLEMLAESRVSGVQGTELKRCRAQFCLEEE